MPIAQVYSWEDMDTAMNCSPRMNPYEYTSKVKNSYDCIYKHENDQVFINVFYITFSWHNLENKRKKEIESTGNTQIQIFG